MQAQDGRYTDLDGEDLSGKTYPFNWDQGLKLLVDDTPAAVLTRGEAEGTTVTVTDGAWVTHAQAIAFRYTVINSPLETTLPIPVEKVLRGRDMKAREFAFILRPIDMNGVRSDPLQVIWNPAGAAYETVTFNFSLDYTTAGALSAPYQDVAGNAVFLYAVYEQQGLDERIVYSDRQYIVRVTLSQDGARLVATPQYFLYEGSGALPAGATAGIRLPG